MLTNNSYALSSNALWFPNVVGDPAALDRRTSTPGINVGAFAAPTPGTFGNMGRNAVYGPGLTSINMSLIKTFSIS